jgi:predicted ATPase/class 3 adenylate cyclase
MNAPTGTITFLFTDIEGSTKLWETHPDAMKIALARHDALMRSAIEKHGGYVFKTIGDAFCAAFATAPEAVSAALEAQSGMTKESWPDGISLKVRMALHTGAVENRDNDYFGPPLNRVARLLSTCHGGQTILSLATQELVRDSLPPQTTLKDLGEHRLKDLARPEHVFQLQHSDLQSEFPALKSLDSIALPNNLPQQVTSFIGREKELTEVQELLSKTKLLTLTGAGGSGKSRLSLQAAAELLEGFSDGAFLVELAPLSDPDLVAQTVAGVLGIKEEAGHPILATLTESLKTKNLLLLLDNCEHVLDASAKLADALMRNCPNVKILATSREGLGIAGESMYRIPSLSLPDPKQTQTAESLSHFESVRLFIDRALQTQPNFAVTNENAPALASICFRLDGIPLAIELAAARARSLSVEDINTKLDQRFRLLTGGSRTALPRQQTLRSLIDWSYDLLNASEKTLLLRLSVFAGGWTLEAAEKVCSGEVIEDWDVLDLLTSLVDKSIVTYTENSGHGRYTLLETIKQYARERAIASGESEVIRERHLNYFLMTMEAMDVENSPMGKSFVLFVEQESDNIHIALDWCASHKESEAIIECGMRLSNALSYIWHFRGYLHEGKQYLERFIELEHTYKETRTLEREKILSSTYCKLAQIAVDQSDFETINNIIENGLVIARNIKSDVNIIWLQTVQGWALINYGYYENALSMFEEILKKCENKNERAYILFTAISVSCLGKIMMAQDDLVAAKSYFEQSLSRFHSINDSRGVANQIEYLGHVAKRQGDFVTAARLLSESLQSLREEGNLHTLGTVLLGLSHAKREQGDVVGARSLVKECLLLNQRGRKVDIPYALEEMGAVLLCEQHPQRAVRLWSAAQTLREQSGRQEPYFIRQQDAWINEARTTLGNVAFDAAWQEGRELTLEQAVALALERSS